MVPDFLLKRNRLQFRRVGPSGFASHVVHMAYILQAVLDDFHLKSSMNVVS